jgi:hypothetical protein
MSEAMWTNGASQECPIKNELLGAKKFGTQLFYIHQHPCDAPFICKSLGNKANHIIQRPTFVACGKTYFSKFNKAILNRLHAAFH